jgi:hypothetical protein
MLSPFACPKRASQFLEGGRLAAPEPYEMREWKEYRKKGTTRIVAPPVAVDAVFIISRDRLSRLRCR